MEAVHAYASINMRSGASRFSLYSADHHSLHRGSLPSDRFLQFPFDAMQYLYTFISNASATCLGYSLLMEA